MKDFISRSLEGLILKIPVLTRSNKTGMGIASEKRGSLWENQYGGFESTVEAQAVQKGRKKMELEVEPETKKSRKKRLGFWESFYLSLIIYLSLLLPSHFSCVRLCVTPQMAAHQVLLSLGFSRQEHWSGLPFPSPKHESESEVAQSCPTLLPHGLQLTRLLHPWDFPGKSTGVGCHCLLCYLSQLLLNVNLQRGKFKLLVVLGTLKYQSK